MELQIKPGKYILAVSGGVDSMVLLNLLAKKPGVELVVAHFNHGIRDDAPEDEELVRQKAKQLDLPFEVGYGHLGAKISEEQARNARYKFLEKVTARYKAIAIITAHHQDDLIETAFINILRGTGRKGLVAIASNRKVIRPLLGYSKEEILNYAQNNGIMWREDASNRDEAYLRNYVRQKLVARLSQAQRVDIVRNIDLVAGNENEINSLIATLSQTIYKNGHIDRQAFVSIPINLSEELLTYWLRQKEVPDIDKKIINRLSIAIRTSRAGTTHPVNGNLQVLISRTSAEFNYTA